MQVVGNLHILSVLSVNISRKKAAQIVDFEKNIYSVPVMYHRLMFSYKTIAQLEV